MSPTDVYFSKNDDTATWNSTFTIDCIFENNAGQDGATIARTSDDFECSVDIAANTTTCGNNSDYSMSFSTTDNTTTFTFTIASFDCKDMGEYFCTPYNAPSPKARITVDMTGKVSYILPLTFNMHCSKLYLIVYLSLKLLKLWLRYRTT